MHFFDFLMCQKKVIKKYCKNNIEGETKNEERNYSENNNLLAIENFLLPTNTHTLYIYFENKLNYKFSL